MSRYASVCVMLSVARIERYCESAHWGLYKGEKFAVQRLCGRDGPESTLHLWELCIYAEILRETIRSLPLEALQFPQTIYTLYITFPGEF